MPIYPYECKCGNKFEKLFQTFSLAKSHEDSTKCDKCGAKAPRVLSGRAPTFFMKFGDAPVYSSNSNTDKNG